MVWLYKAVQINKQAAGLSTSADDTGPGGHRVSW